MSKISEGQSVLWQEQPATDALKHYLQRKLHWLQSSRANVFFPGEAYRTQEAIISINARLEEVIALLGVIGDFQTFLDEVNQESDDDAEHERHKAGRLPGVGQA